MQLKGKKMNCLGDSITAGACVPSAEYAYPALIAVSEQLNVVRNYGISATRIAKQIGVDNDENFCSRIQRMDADADIVTVLGGTNDYGHGNAPIGTGQDKTPDTYCGACECLCTGLKHRFPNAKIVIMTPLSRSLQQEIPKAEDTDRANNLGTYVEILDETAKRHGFYVLDLYRNTELNANADGSKYFADGLHLNVEGHRKLTEILAEFLKTI